MTLIDALKFKKLSPETCKKSKNSIIESLNFHPVRGRRESALLEQILRDAGKSNTLVMTIRDNGSLNLDGILGLVAMSVGKLEIHKEAFPAVVIDFLMVNHRYRAQTYGDDDMKISTALMKYALKTAKDITELVGVRYLILRPNGGKDNLDLVTFYESMGFRYMTAQHEWMYLKLT